MNQQVADITTDGEFMTKKSDRYFVTIIGWEKHNPKVKKGFTHFMFHSGFFQDASITQLTQIETLLYINLMCIACESLCNRITIAPRSMPKHLMIGPQRLHDALLRLEQLQLVTFEKIAPLRIEVNRKESKVKEMNAMVSPSESQSQPALPLTNRDEKVTAIIWRSYSKSYESRYKTKPTWNAKVAGQIKHFSARVPAAEAAEIASFYVGHNGARYIGSGHAIGNLLLDAEKIRTEWLTGRKITTLDARNAESADALKNQISRLTQEAQ
jgi:hypothetical protein